ncbi:MAG: sulfatase-like hydrolase/transferase [Verrucomicrobiota bacterium]
MKIVTFLLFCAFSVVFAADKPSNVLLIVSDDQGYADLGCIGQSNIQTPNLDRLAKEGVRLTSFYVAWPACTPSRSALLTGRYPQRNGIYDMIRNEAPDYGHKYNPADYLGTFERVGGMDTREVIIPALLREEGYKSGIFGKWDLGIHKRFLPLARGFDEFYGFVNTGIDYYTHERYGVPSMYRNNEPTEEDKGVYCTYLFQREAMRFLQENWEQPFFLYVPFNAPHNSSSLDPKIRTTIQAPEKFQELYPPVEKETRSLPSYKRYSVGEFTEEVEVTTPEARTRDFRASVTCMDAAIGEMLDFLDEKGIAENTLVIFHSDNGGGGGSDNTPLRGGKSQMFEGGNRVPCLIRWPQQLPAGKVNDEFLTTLELFPTIAAAAGATPKKDIVLDGFDMTEVLQGDAPSPRNEMFWERRADKAARVGEWKWVESQKGRGLFNLAEDIGEKNDLSKSNPEMLQKLKDRFAAWKVEMEAAEPRGPFRDF